MSTRASIVASLIFVGCTASSGPPPGPTPVPPAVDAPASAPNEPAQSGEPAQPIEPAQPGEHEVVARILEAGPLGHGNCVQRSYKIEVTATRRGAPLESPTWVHFERCQGSSSTIDAGNLEVGASYRLQLRRDASANFAGAPMIVGFSREG